MENSEYLVLDGKSEYWRNQPLFAKLLDKMPGMNVDDLGVLRVSPINPAPPLLRFIVNEKAPVRDNVWNDHYFDLYSMRVVELLESFGVQFETFPVDLVGRHSKSLGLNYKMFHLMESLSVYRDGIPDNGIIDAIRMACVNSQRAMFRIDEFRHMVMVRPDVVQTFETHNVSGFLYRNLQEYRDLLLW